MAIRKPLVVINGQVQQVPAGDTINDPTIGSYAPGAFSVASGQYALMAKRLVLTTTQRTTLVGDARLTVI